MKVDVTLAIEALGHVPAMAREAEALGFDGLWTAETRHDPVLPLALAAEHTRRVSLGTAIAVAFLREHRRLGYPRDVALPLTLRLRIHPASRVHLRLERAERRCSAVSLRDERGRDLPGDLELAVREVASQLVRRVPLVRRGVDVHRVLAEEEAVGDAARDHDRRQFLARELHDSREPERRRAPPEIAEADARVTREDDEVVVVPEVDVYAAEDPGPRPHDVPLRGVDRGLPGPPEELGDRASVVAVRGESPDVHAGRKAPVAVHGSYDSLFPISSRP